MDTLPPMGGFIDRGMGMGWVMWGQVKLLKIE